MATQGPFVLFDRSKLYIGDGSGLTAPADTFSAVLATSAQALDHTFLGGSGDCRYADLTNELSTANGYTSGGLTMPGVAITRSSPTTVQWTSSPLVWTLSNTITFKYLIIVNKTVTNANLLGYCDMDTGGGSVSPIIGTLTVTPGPWFTYT